MSSGPMNTEFKSVILFLILCAAAITFVLPAPVSGDQTLCLTDFNQDQAVDALDLAAFSEHYGRTDCSTATPCNGDFAMDDDSDGPDGDSDGQDLALLIKEFGRTDCPGPHPLRLSHRWTARRSPVRTSWSGDHRQSERLRNRRHRQWSCRPGLRVAIRGQPHCPAKRSEHHRRCRDHAVRHYNLDCNNRNSRHHRRLSAVASPPRSRNSDA